MRLHRCTTRRLLIATLALLLTLRPLYHGQAQPALLDAPSPQSAPGGALHSPAANGLFLTTRRGANMIMCCVPDVGGQETCASQGGRCWVPPALFPAAPRSDQNGPST